LKLLERIYRLTEPVIAPGIENDSRVDKGKDPAAVIDVDAGAGDDGDDEDEDEALPALPPPVIRTGEASSSRVSQGNQSSTRRCFNRLPANSSTFPSSQP
jgi:hypothetical protein